MFQLWKVFTFFSSHTYANALLLNLLHLQTWRKQTPSPLDFVLNNPILINKEPGENSLSVLSRKLKVSNNKNQLAKLNQEFHILPQMRDFQKQYKEEFETVQRKKPGSIQGLTLG